MNKFSNSGLSLEMSLNNMTFGNTGNESTYRAEGLTIGMKYARLFGEEIESEVMYEDLVLGRKLGQGMCSEVYLSQNTFTSKKYAIKMFNIDDNSQARQLCKEIKVLATVACDCIVAFKGAFHNSEDRRIGIILEYMDLGTLEFILNPEVILTEEAISSICYQMLWGLGYLHFEHKLHRDIKPANVLINSQGFVKLSDFGISKDLTTTQNVAGTAVGSFRYMAPERLDSDNYEYSSDIWSVGIVLWHLWDKVYPFESSSGNPIEILISIEDSNFSQLLSPRRYPKLMREVLLFMLNKNPSKRLTCIELAESSWFTTCGIHVLGDTQAIIKDWIEHINHRQTTKPKKSSIKHTKQQYYDDQEEEYEDDFHYEDPSNDLTADISKDDDYHSGYSNRRTSRK